MKGGDPSERGALEIKILCRLIGADYATATLSSLKSWEPDHQEAITCTVFDLKDDGLVSLRDLGGDHLVTLTPQGREVLVGILSGKTSC